MSRDVVAFFAVLAVLALLALTVLGVFFAALMGA